MSGWFKQKEKGGNVKKKARAQKHEAETLIAPYYANCYFVNNQYKNANATESQAASESQQNFHSGASGTDTVYEGRICLCGTIDL